MEIADSEREGTVETEEVNSREDTNRAVRHSLTCRPHSLPFTFKFFKFFTLLSLKFKSDEIK